MMELLNIKYFTVGWGQSRLIREGADREIVAHLLTPLGGFIMMKKRGGFICYRIVQDATWESCWRSLEISEEYFLKCIKKYKKFGCDVHFPNSIKIKLRNYMIMKQL